MGKDYSIQGIWPPEKALRESRNSTTLRARVDALPVDAHCIAFACPFRADSGIHGEKHRSGVWAEAMRLDADEKSGSLLNASPLSALAVVVNHHKRRQKPPFSFPPQIGLTRSALAAHDQHSGRYRRSGNVTALADGSIYVPSRTHVDSSSARRTCMVNQDYGPPI